MAKAGNEVREAGGGWKEIRQYGGKKEVESCRMILGTDG